MSKERDKNKFRFCRKNKITKRFTLSRAGFCQEAKRVEATYFFDLEESEVIFILLLTMVREGIKTIGTRLSVHGYRYTVIGTRCTVESE